MIMSKYSFPLPNNGERYDLSQDELIKLLDAAYDSGWQYGYHTAQVKYDKNMTSVAHYDIQDDEWIEINT